jgi:ubiquinone/menaquinone biosynthesis C-methylase UbiE
MHLQYLKRFLNFENKKILDMGCGIGKFLLECCQENLDIVGIDINPEYLEICEKNFKGTKFKPSLFLAEAENLPFKNNSFDFINCTELLEHVKRPQKVLNEIYRILKTDGFAFITIHNRFGIKDPHYKLWFLNWMPRFLGTIYIKITRRYKNPKNFLDIQTINKMNYFTYLKIKKIIKKTGFNMEDTREIQINNPELIINKKKIFKNKRINLFIYKLLRIFYFNTFHLILKK